MVLKKKASLEFIGKAPADKVTYGANAVGKLTLNVALFPNLPVSLANLGTAQTNLATAVIASASGSYLDKAALTNSEKIWDDDFRQTANYVTAVANGDEEIIIKGGCVATKGESSPAVKPIEVQNFQLTVNNSAGSVHMQCDPLHNAAAYVYFLGNTNTGPGVEVTFQGDVMVIDVNGTKFYLLVDTHCRANINGLPTGVNVGGAMYAVNRAGIGPATPAQEVIPQ